MKYILHIDTSTENAVVALGIDGDLVGFRLNTEARNHAAAINTMIEELLAEAGIQFSQLAAIDVCGGPGSYTGLRIGLSTAKGLCYALDIPLLMQNRLLLMLLPYLYDNNVENDVFIAVLPARSKEYFIAAYDKNLSAVIAPQHINEDQLNSLPEQLIRDAFIVCPDNIQEFLISASMNPSAIFLNNVDLKSWVSVSYHDFNCNGFVKMDSAEPFYLKQVYTHNPVKNN